MSQNDQEWDIGLIIPSVSDKESEMIFSEVTKALYEITDKYPHLKDWKGFKHYHKERDEF